MSKSDNYYREALIKYLDGDYPHPRIYRPDACPHNKYYYEECSSCDEEYWENVLDKRDFNE